MLHLGCVSLGWATVFNDQEALFLSETLLLAVAHRHLRDAIGVTLVFHYTFTFPKCPFAKRVDPKS